MGILSAFKKEKNVINFDVAGIGYRTDTIKSIMKVSAKYKKPFGDRRVYKYKFMEGPCELVPEPKNPTDKNAVMVVCGGVHVGYVPADQAAQIKKLIKKYDATIKIHGGRYKEFDAEDDEWIVRDGSFSGEVTMVEK